MNTSPGFRALSRVVLFALLHLTACRGLAADAPAAAPAEPAAATKTFDDHLVQANVLFKAGKLGESLAEVQAAAKLDAKRYEAPATAALILHAAGKPAEARGALDAAMKLAPVDKQEQLQNIGKLLSSTHRCFADQFHHRDTPSVRDIGPDHRRSRQVNA